MDFTVADELNDPWITENIPNQDKIYMRVHRNMIKNGQPSTGIFKNQPTSTDGMSTDWEKYSTPEDTRNRVAPSKDPANYGVISMQVENVKNVPNQTVVHTPDIPNNNRAHTDVFGEKDAEARVHFGRIFELEFLPENL
jgi:hypothetical protein